MMKGIDKIFQRLVADTEAEIAALNAETAEKREAILAEYRQKAQEAYETRMQEGAKACEARMQRLSSTADTEARKGVLSFKQELVSKAFAAAEEKLCQLPREEYIRFLGGLAAKASSFGTEELVFNEKDAASVGREVCKAANALLRERGLTGGLTVSEETREIPGGLILRQGNIEVNCAVDTLLRMSRGELASQVAEILFA